MASAKHSQDRNYYMVIDPTDENQPVLVFDEDEAFDIWAADRRWLVHSYNPVEHVADILTDDFLDRLEKELDDARDWQRHLDCYARAS